MAVNKVKEILRFLYYLRFSEPNPIKRRYPRVIQLPITYQCNSRCVMCDVWNMDYSNQLTSIELGEVLSDPLFKRVKSVGINGGEPSLVKDLPDYVTQILKLPSLKSLNIISHGFNTKRLLNMLEKIYKLTTEAGVTFHVSISLDGYKEIHNEVRGAKVFEKTFATILALKESRFKYCDSFNIGCTVIEQNVDHLIELDTWMEINGLSNHIKYRMGIDNLRIDNYKLKDKYQIQKNTRTYFSALEFFQSKIHTSSKLDMRFRYFGIYYGLLYPGKYRIGGCHWQNSGATLDSRGEIYFCSVASQSLGKINGEGNGKALFLSDTALSYRRKILKEECNSCNHDYTGEYKLKSLWLFAKYFINHKYFELRCREILRF